MSFINELKRRNVIRVGIAYIVIAWLLAQVAELALDSFEAPGWVIKTILLLLALGFPLALFFAWAFELTPEGIKKEKHVDRTESITHITGRKLDFTIIGLMAIALIYFASTHDWSPDTPETTPTAIETKQETLRATEPEDLRQSIAVLPFKDFSQDQDSEYFADGLADTLLHMLAQIRDLRVAARTSSFAFKESTDDIRNIGLQLDVDTILEGSVQKAGGTLRIIAQLINVDDGSHLWSKTFDRPDADIFAIQDEIATSVVGALEVTVMADASGFSKPATENLQAYDAYVLGRHHINRRNKADLEKALQYFQQAVEIDPDYALAWVGVADSFQLLEDHPSSYGDLSRAEVVAGAKPALDQAIALNPDLAEAHTSLAMFMLGDDPRAALASLKKAIELNPNYAIAHMRFGHALMAEGRVREAAQAYHKAERLDPLSPVIASNAAYSYVYTGEIDRAARRFEEIRKRFPESTVGGRQATRLSFSIGKMDQAAIQNLDNLRRNPTHYLFNAWMGLIYLNMDDVSTAEAWLSEHRLYLRILYLISTEQWDEVMALETPLLAAASDADERTGIYNKLAVVEMKRGNLTAAAEYFDLAEAASPDFASYLKGGVLDQGELTAIDRANLYQRRGDTQKAGQYLDIAAEIIQNFKDEDIVWNRLDYVEAQYYAIKGDYPAALKALRQAYDHGFRDIALNKDRSINLEALRDYPEYQEILADIKADLAAQRQRLEQNLQFVWGAPPSAFAKQ